MSTSVPPAPEATEITGETPRRRPPAPWLPLGALVLALALLLGATRVELPYYAVLPGEAVGIGGMVEVRGASSFPPEGEIYLATVRLRQVTLVEAVQGWLSPTTDVVGRGVVAPPEVSDDALRVFNLHQMDVSKGQAVAVALEELGYDAISGSGAEVVEVVADSPADGALVPGDVIVALGDTPVTAHVDVLNLLGQKRPGDHTELTVDGAGSGGQRTVELTLAAGPDAERAVLGAMLTTRDFSFDLPFQVDISSDRIGGPSAGLAFTLQVLDLLTTGELSGGRRVAATGTIELDGSVGEVGGVAQKTAAVRRAGIELFLVPRAELAQAVRVAGDDVRVQPVDTLADALRALAGNGGDPLPAGS